MPKDMQGIWDDTMKCLRQATNAKNAENVDLVCSSQQNTPALSLTPFSHFVEPKEPTGLIFGHYHKPRAKGKRYEVGGFVEQNSTFLNIYSNGSIDRIDRPEPGRVIWPGDSFSTFADSTLTFKEC